MTKEKMEELENEKNDLYLQKKAINKRIDDIDYELNKEYEEKKKDNDLKNEGCCFKKITNTTNKQCYIKILCISDYPFCRIIKITQNNINIENKYRDYPSNSIEILEHVDLFGPNKLTLMINKNMPNILEANYHMISNEEFKEKLDEVTDLIYACNTYEN